jgi:hypothetical protein
MAANVMLPIEVEPHGMSNPSVQTPGGRLEIGT